jgi:hypothetical protein
MQRYKRKFNEELEQIDWVNVISLIEYYKNSLNSVVIGSSVNEEPIAIIEGIKYFKIKGDGLLFSAMSGSYVEIPKKSFKYAIKTETKSPRPGKTDIAIDIYCNKFLYSIVF